jgi:ABC-type multidrug transport system ATPase subunit
MHIQFANVTKRYGRVSALDQVTLEFTPGQIVAALGANGAGKTTLLRCLATIVAPGKGQILIDGQPLSRDRIDLRRRIMFLPDGPVAYAHLTPLRHIAMVLGLYGKSAEGIAYRATDVLGSLDLLPLIDTPLGRMSRGQIYKTMLAALFLADPELWLLDEPLASGIDPAGIIYFKQQCRDAAGRGRTVIYSTQLLDIAEKFSDRVCILQSGKVRFFDTVDAILSSAAQPQSSLEDVFSQLREVVS